MRWREAEALRGGVGAEAAGAGQRGEDCEGAGKMGRDTKSECERGIGSLLGLPASGGGRVQ